MKTSKTLFSLILFSLLCPFLAAQTGERLRDPEGHIAIRLPYKSAEMVDLAMRVYYPETMETKDPFPAIVFFFGGGWINGNLEEFAPHERYYAKRGMVAVLADYRVERRHGTTPFDAVRDAKSAIRFLRDRANDLMVDPEKIAAAGGSAGGHLAAPAGTVKGLEEPGEDHGISFRPNALVLFNPVFDNGPGGYGFDRVGGEARFREISPMHNISPDTPPTLVFLGTNYDLSPVGTAVEYARRMDEAGVYCEVHLYGQQPHGFFNARSPEFYEKTVSAADEFLRWLGYLP